MPSRRALITGLTGQDGSFLAELLLAQGYAVSGVVRRPAQTGLGASEHLRGQIQLIQADLLVPESLIAAVREADAEEIYHLAAPSFAPDSWAHPSATLAAIAAGTATLLEAVRDHNPQTRVFVAASGAMFGAAPGSPQTEDTPCRPLTPYAVAKLAAHQLVGMMRARDGLFACSGILYNHESERRPERFLPRKVARAAAAIKLGRADRLTLGDLSASRDWSFAGDVVRGAWLMLQQDSAADYILCSGRLHTVAELAELAFDHVGLKASDHIEVDPELVRAAELTAPVGDPSRARERLGWAPALSFEALIRRMVDADLQALGGTTR